MRPRGIQRQYQVETLEARTLFNAGALDTSFNFTGKVSLSNIPNFRVNGVATQSDGKTIVVGTFLTEQHLVCVERLNVNGSVDTTFGTDGSGVIRLTYLNGAPASASVDASAVAVQTADDKIVIVGTMHVTGGDFGYVARLNANGAVDTNFGDFHGYSGIYGYDTPASAENFANDVVIQQDGKIVVAGTAVRDNGVGLNFAVTRLTTSGQPDNSFDGNGRKDFAIGSTYDQVSHIAIDYSGTKTTNSNFGKIVLGGTDGLQSAFAVARLNTDGSLDSSFSGDGMLISSYGSQFSGATCTGVAVQSTGKIVIEGDVYPTSNPTVPEVGLFRLNSNGLGDSTFGNSNGQTIVGFVSPAYAGGLINGESGRLIVGGSSANDTTQIACLSADGILDPYFGSAGILTINFQSSTDSNSSDGASDLVLEPGGTIVAAGDGGDGVARFFDRKAETVSIGTLQPVMSEQGPTSTTFLVTRLERLSTDQQVILDVSGTANRPGNTGRRPIDYTGTNITFATTAFNNTFVDIPANETFVEVTIKPVDDALVEGDETAIFSVSGTTDYDVTSPTSTTLVIHDNDISAGPSVRSSAFNYDSGPPQNVTFAFDQDVKSSISASDFTVAGPSGAVPYTLTYDSVNDLATLNFNSILPNGNYTATAIASGITNSAGTHMAANSALKFFFVNGDANHDRVANALDFNALATNYGKAGTFSQGDFNYSGTVDSNDFSMLASGFGTSLAPPSGSALPKNVPSLLPATSLDAHSLNLFNDQTIKTDNGLLDDPPVSLIA